MLAAAERDATALVREATVPTRPTGPTRSAEPASDPTTIDDRPEPPQPPTGDLPRQGTRSDLSGDEASDLLRELGQRRIARLSITWELE